MLIAIGKSNWDYYLHQGSDGLIITAEAKPGKKECRSCTWCPAGGLRKHLRHLANIKFGKNWETAVPDDWELTDDGEKYLKQLGII